MKTRFIVLTLVCLCAVGTLFAQGVQTGTLEGTVTGPEGTPLPGVMVTVTSPALMGERQAVTSATGDYILRGLTPGAYTVRFTLEGMRAPQQKVQLALGATSRADATMKVSTVSEAITVTASAPTVLENTSVGANIKSDTVQALPVLRTPTDIASLAPGLTGDRGGRAGTPVAGQVSMSGGMAYDNALLINGVNFADNIFGTANNLFVEDAIQETQVLTSGISAEYGHFTGGVLNVITKSGGNAFTGSLRANLSNPKWLALTPYEQGFRGEGVPTKPQAPHADKLSKVYELTLGGPILKDRLWFFVAGRDEKSATAGNLGVTGYPYTVNVTNRRPEYKLTGNIASNHTLQFDWINNPVNRDNEIQVTPIDSNAISHNTSRPNRGWVANYQGVLTGNLFAEARYSKKMFGFINLGGTSTAMNDSPILTDTRYAGVTQFGTYNAPYFDATDPEYRNNHESYAALSYFLSKPRLGTHDIKAGYEQFVDTRTGGNSQSATSYVFYAGYQNNNGTPVLDSNGHLIPVWTPYDGENSDYSLIQWWIASRGSELDTTTNSYFVNDRWSLNSYFTFNIGVRYEQVKSKSTGGIISVDTSGAVPRLAASYDPKGNGKYKFDVTYGEYAGRYNPGVVGANSSVGNPAYLYGYYIGPAGVGKNFAPGFDPKNYVFYTGSIPTMNVAVAKGLHSPVNKEWTLSGGMQLPKNGWGKLTFTDRKYTDFINGFTTYNLGCTKVVYAGLDMGCLDNILYQNTNGPKRHYQAAEVQAHVEPAHAWAVDGNWTHQLKNDGNYEGESGQSLPTSAFGNYPEMQSPREFPVGHLSQYQKDKIRLWTTYLFDMRAFGNLSAGLLYRYDSPLTFSYTNTVTRSAYSKAQNPGYQNPSSRVTVFYGDRGAGQYNASSLFDASLQYSLPISRVTPWVKVDVRNIFNKDTLIAFNTAVSPDTTSPKDSWGYYTGYTKNSTFGRPSSATSYVRPREVLVYLGVRF